MSAQSTEEFRVRIDRTLIKQAKLVAEEIGTTPGEVVRLLFHQMVKRRTIPFPFTRITRRLVCSVRPSAVRRSGTQ
jgi:antitoxin component of RelBE/YafQ-DinJ toxin-antitoxin module